MNRTRARAVYRHQALCRVRRFFDQRNATEVCTPVITDNGVTDVHLENLSLADGRFLRTSPEYAHKRLLADGVGDLWELGPVFRAGEQGRLHREEFLMLEWYRVGWNWRELAAEVLELIRTFDSGCQIPGGVMFRRWQDLATETLGFNPLRDPVALASLLRQAPSDLDFPEQLDWLFAMHMQPALAGQGIVVVHDYPACQAALARLDPHDPEVAQRFEVIVNGIEIANGYQELTDAEEQARRFAEDNQRRVRMGLAEIRPDPELLGALRRGLPDCAGVALGFDRLLMIVSGGRDIHDILSTD